MARMLSRWLDSRRCDVHDVATPAKIARLESETGIDPYAEAAMMERARTAAPADVVAWFYDPDLTDCGRRWCRKRRGLA